MNSNMIYREQRAGFWIRAAAYGIDVIWMYLLIIMLIVLEKKIPDSEAIIAIFDFLLMTVIYVLFWYYKSATPGKMLLGLKIVNRENGGRLTMGQCLGRYFAYLISTLIFFLDRLYSQKSRLA